MAPYDGSFRDVANRLKDDDLVSLKLVNEASDMIMRYGLALERIKEFGYDHSGYGHSCARLAAETLDNTKETK